ncbi:MAG TPA: FHA domain-containing protein [Arachnia sp.]|nr:FHA domain-containing protein [Arachnia sp.]HMR13532.1 FHA domain-containing protein [Arachnia sp.]
MRQFGRRAAIPAEIGPRVLARIVDSLLGTIVVYGMPALGMSDGIVLVFAVVLLAGQLYLMYTRSTSFGHMVAKTKFLRLPSGEDAKGQFILRTFVTAGFEGATLGLGAISYFVTYRDGQHWLDRAFSTVCVMTESVRDVAPLPGPPPLVVGPAGVTPVGMPARPTAPAAPPAAFASHQSSGQAPAAPQAAPQPFAPPAVHGFTPPGPPPTSFTPPAPVAPFTPPAPVAPIAPPQAASFRPPAAPESGGFQPPSAPQPPSAMLNDRTVLDPEFAEPPAPVVVLDDGSRIALDATVVLGRNPVAPPEHPGARCIPVTDTSMRASKTHVAVFADQGEVKVADLGATNGLVLELGGVKSKLASNETHTLPSEGVLHFGGRSLRVATE